MHGCGKLRQNFIYNQAFGIFIVTIRELQVFPIAEAYMHDEEKMKNVFIYDDGIVKGFIEIIGKEIKKLYVDTFFQGNGIGAALVEYAITEKQVSFLWALEKNVRAIKFYKRHGFHMTKERIFEEGTKEYLVQLER